MHSDRCRFGHGREHVVDAKQLIMKNLIIVESPAKAKTIEKFLGSDYKVMSSVGHVRDLRKKDFSINIDGGFVPEYEIPADHRDIVKKLKSAASEADIVWLASDEDREGEAIAWHLYEVLGLKPDKTRRIVFHEITKPAILHAIENPRSIDIGKVNAQQARRVLDRIVGFELSPVLWRKIKPALSAGRVQSVAVRLICEREKEIRDFVPEPFFRVAGEFKSDTGISLKGELPTRFHKQKEAEDFLQACSIASFSVSDISEKPVKRSPQPPFTTSTLQQEASRKLSMSVQRTMSVAQQLYEAGHITYMRTDSLNLSDLALRDIASRVKSDFGAEYSSPRKWHTHSKGAQEAHEAIRPTYINVVQLPDATPQMQSLYNLIRRRTLASQMADAELLKTNVEIAVSNRKEHFLASGERLVFPGFLKAYGAEDEEKAEKGESSLAQVSQALQEGASLQAEVITATERFTQAPPRYSEASLVKKMEELGIGRPSTYAPTISTIQTREYVEKGEKEGLPRNYVRLSLANGKIRSEELTENSGSERGKLIPTDVGMVVNDFLTEFFPDILDYNFTAHIEEKFDHIAEGKIPWNDEIKEFYHNFHPDIEKVNSMRMEHKVGERHLGTHPVSGKPVSVKIGRYGPLVQIGDPNDEVKPQFASLLKGQSVGTITLEEALKLFELPRTVGEYKGNTITAAIGRFGPYLRYDGKFVSIPKDLAPLTITLPEAIELIEAKQKEEADKIVKQFPEEPGLEVVNGRYGVYLAYKPEGAKKAKNYKIPKGTDATALTLEEARQIMEAQDKAPASPRRARSKKS